jgi:hypothetical protein
MKPTRTIEDIDSLLGRGSIGASRRDAILQTVLARVQAETSARTRRWWSFAGLGCAAAAVALIFLMPSFSPPSSPPFRAKGTVSITPSVQVECLGATLARCPTGSLLVVRVDGVRGFVSAWAEPLGGGERVWYFSAETFSPLVDGISAAPAAATRAVRIGPEHALGTFVVYIRVTLRPIGRDDLLRLSATAALVTAQVSLSVTSP